MNRTIRSVFFRVLCAGLALLLLAGCADGGSTASSSKAAVSGGEGSASVDSETGEPVLSGDASEAASGDASAAATSSAAPVQTGVVADIPQKAADPVAVEETKAGKLSSFNVSKTGILQAYPEYDERIERDYTYTVTVTQGSNVRSLTCYNHCDAVASSDRTLNGDTVRRFCEFAFSGGPVRVDIAVKQDFKSYTVMPSAKGFKSERHDNVISVYLEKPDYFLLKLDNKDDSILSVFADEPEVDVPKKGDPNVIYIEGWYDPGNWYLDVIKDGTTVYLAPGSVLNARLCVRGDNVTVKGRGMILDSFSNIYKQDVSIDRTVNGTVLRVFAVRGSNCTVDGIKMIDARDFNLIVGGSNTKVRNFKVLSSEMCTDGITQAGGSNNSYEHCFIYNGDNGIVVSTGKNQKYKDITIGTICSALFPQLSVGEIDMENIYVFRADGGLMWNTYNPNGTVQTFDIKFTNVSCVDCDHFSMLFGAANMGDGKKVITFKNIAVPYATGSDTSMTASQWTPTLREVWNSVKPATNYTLNFDGLSIGGNAITNANQIPKDNELKSTYVVTGNGASWPAKAATVSGSVTAPGKIFIGNRQLFLKYGAVEQGGTWYVPAADVCKALGCSVPSGTTQINGIAYLSLTALKSAGCTTSATYDSGKKAVRIAAVDRGVNLLAGEGTSVHSRWSEWICYDTHLLYIKDAAGDYFYNKNSNSYDKWHSGASYNLTQQVNQYGKGTYTLTVDMKADKACSCGVGLTVNGSLTEKSANLTTDWKTYTFTFNVSQDQVNNAALLIMTKVKDSGIAFRNPKLVHTK